MKKKIFYCEAAYLIGVAVLAFSAALLEAADFGLSMVVAPAYLLHLKISEFLPFFSFGMAEYTFQALLLILVIIILKKFKFSYLFSFVTAVLYGLLLDGSMALIALVPHGHIAVRILFFILGIILCSASVSLLFHTYISPEVYELFVKEISAKIGMEISKFKTIYDCASCVLAVVISFIFFGFGHFEGVKSGTVICALINGFLIGRFSVFYEKHFEFSDRFKLRKYFE